jgi:dihydrofolate reductase
MRPLILIVAMTPGGVIGKDGKIPWRSKLDMARFKALTMNHSIIMGRKTFDSIGKPLPDRHNIVITRDVNRNDLGDHKNPLLTWAHSIEDALGIAYEYDGRPFVIGGREIYKLAMPFATCVVATYVMLDVSGDVFWPRENGENLEYLSMRTWAISHVIHHEKDESEPELDFVTYVRRTS